MRPVVHTVRSPAIARKALVDLDREMRQRQPRILADRHARRTGMVLHALERDAELTDADDARHHADFELVGLQPVTLLDVGFQIAGIRLRSTTTRGRPASPASLQCIAQG